MTETYPSKPRSIFFFDIDNCLYPRSTRVQDLMQDLIDDYFVRHLELSPEDAKLLHRRYYQDYGLAISGLVKYHKIDPLAYNREVDDALPLDDIIKPDPQLRQLLMDIDTSKVKPWLFTNAHITHARRVVRLLGVDDLFEGITYCDYSKQPLIAKPHASMFDKAETEAGALTRKNCYFVDDSLLNCRHARMRGWAVVHKLEPDHSDSATDEDMLRVRDLRELRELFPDVFKSTSNPFTKHNNSATSQL